MKALPREWSNAFRTLCLQPVSNHGDFGKTDKMDGSRYSNVDCGDRVSDLVCMGDQAPGG